MAPQAPAVEQQAPSAGPEMEKLTEKEQQAVLAFAEKIDLSNSNQILQYGAAAQKNIADFSESALNSVRTKDMGEIGGMLTDLVGELKSFDAGEEEKKGLFGFFRKAGNSIDQMKTKYAKVEANVDRISESLENHQITLLKDVALLDQMYEKNLEYYKQLTMYILAGPQKARTRADRHPAASAEEGPADRAGGGRPSGPTTMQTSVSVLTRNCTIWS